MNFLLFGLATTPHITTSSLMKFESYGMSPFTNMFAMHKGFFLLNCLLYSVAFRSVDVNLYFHKLTQTEALFEDIDVFLTLRK